MPDSVHVSTDKINLSLIQLTQDYDAMQLSQLCAFAFTIPQLYFCREYLAFDEKDAIEACLKRLEKGVKSDIFTLVELKEIVVEKEFYDSEEARLRLAPEPL